MILEKQNMARLYLSGSIVSWLVFFVITFYSAIAGGFDQSHVSKFVSPLYRDTFLNLFILLSFLYFKNKSETEKGTNFQDLIWEGFITASLMTVALVLNQQLAYLDVDFFKEEIFKNTVYAINGVFIFVFMGKIFFVFKRLILYQKSKKLLFAWSVYEVLLVVCLVISHFDFEIDHFHLNTKIFVGSLAIYGLILSMNMKWVAYLNFKQKLKGALLLSIILVITATFVQYLYKHSHLIDNPENQILVNDISQHFFVIVIFLFIIFYCIASILVILFNLPTSSVFEQKLGEVFNFQKLSQSIRTTKDEREIYDILLEISVHTALADGAWLEIADRQKKYKAFLNYQLEKYDAFELKKLFKRNQLDIKSNYQYFPNLKRLKHYDRLVDNPAKSVLTFPLYTSNKFIGVLGLIKHIPDGFNTESIEIIKSFVGQASVSIENSRLLNEAIQTERYKEELKIAKTVQENLLPRHLTFKKNIDISAYSLPADDVGGDYYDTFNIADEVIGVVIGDVSGHGTSAAFNMAQVKGVFQGLMQQVSSPDEILTMANKALSNCLNPQSFVTITILMIDLKNGLMNVARGGHCPTLFFNEREKQADFLNIKGLGLGILRNDSYKDFVQSYTCEINPGDQVLLYTDGVVEAIDSSGNDYGYERIREKFKANIHKNTEEIIDIVKRDVLEFSGKQKLDDDFTLLCLKIL